MPPPRAHVRLDLTGLGAVLALSPGELREPVLVAVSGPRDRRVEAEDPVSNDPEPRDLHVPGVVPGIEHEV